MEQGKYFEHCFSSLRDIFIISFLIIILGDALLGSGCYSHSH